MMMVGSTDVTDDATGENSSSSLIPCSICLDLVDHNGERSIAFLQCGHQFHLDCIGSAFNMKGAMQCPNCRKIEGGRWQFANGAARSFSDFSMDDWTFSEDSYELSYPEMPFGVHWCPFSGLTGVHPAFEEVEPPATTTHHELQGNHAVFAEHLAASSLAHSHFAYVRPVLRGTSNSSENVDDPNSSHGINGQSGQNEIYNPPHAFPATNLQYQSWARHSHPLSANRSQINGGDQASLPPTTLRSTRPEMDAMTRTGPFVHPFLYGHGSVPRVGSSFVSSIIHHGSNNTRSHGSHPLQPGMMSSIIPGPRRFSGPRGLPVVMPTPPHSDHYGGFFILPSSVTSGQNPNEVENHLQWERDPQSRFPTIAFGREDLGWGSSRPYTSGGVNSNRSTNFWRHWS